MLLPRIAVHDVVLAIDPGAVDVAGSCEIHALDIERGGEGHRGENRVHHALRRQLAHRVARIVDVETVIARAARHRVKTAAADQDVGEGRRR